MGTTKCNECDQKTFIMHNLSEYIKNVYESDTYKWYECDNVDNWMCDVKECMMMRGIMGHSIGDNECNS